MVPVLAKHDPSYRSSPNPRNFDLLDVIIIGCSVCATVESREVQRLSRERYSMAASRPTAMKGGDVTIAGPPADTKRPG